MKAYTYIEKGKFALTEKPKPTLQDNRDAIVRVTLSSICTSDLHIKHGSVPRAMPGITVGHEMVGIVESIGADVKTVKPGDRVTVNVETYCGSAFSASVASSTTAPTKTAVGRLVAELTAVRPSMCACRMPIKDLTSSPKMCRTSRHSLSAMCWRQDFGRRAFPRLPRTIPCSSSAQVLREFVHYCVQNCTIPSELLFARATNIDASL